jgi:hypothetical protein
MLWGRAANRCSFPSCRAELVVDPTETDDASLIGEACHIVGDSRKGPRGLSKLTDEQRDKYNNLILLCSVHHKIVDDQPKRYTVDWLKKSKKEHEEWVRTTLNLDMQKQRDDEVYASYVEEWGLRCDLDNWTAWTSGLVSHGQPSVLAARLQRLIDLRDWLFKRVWPHRYTELEASFENFLAVLDDLLVLFQSRAQPIGQKLFTEKFYHRARVNSEYNRLSHEYDLHVDLVEDLALELTRAANYVCDQVRRFVDHSFRLNQGVLLIQSGMDEELNVSTHRVEYRGRERTLRPYPGLREFKKARLKRDAHFGRQ